jgi:hypothetical protein
MRLVSVVKMATVLEKSITEKHRSFVRAKRFNAKDIHKEMFPACSGKCLSRKAVHNWVKKLPPWWETFR